MHVIYKRTRSLEGSLALFSCTKKYKHLEAFFRTLSMWSLHDKSLVIVTPSFALWTTSSSWPFTTTGCSSGWFLANEILSSFHFSLFSFTLLSVDHWATSSAICWALLSQPLGTTSDDAVSSTYFHSLAFKLSLRLRSFIRMRKSQGPSFVPWGTPEGTVPHSEKHPSANLIRCKRSSKKLIIQLITLTGKSSLLSLFNYKNVMIYQVKCFAIVK